VTGRNLIVSEYLKRVCSQPGFFAFGKVKNARAPLGPEYIANVSLKAMAEAGIDTAGWKAQSLRGAAATHFMAKGVPGAVVQARGGWASAATMATHYARQHQLIPWAELASSPPLTWHCVLGMLLLLLQGCCPGPVSVQFSQFRCGVKNRDHCWMVQIVRDEW